MGYGLWIYEKEVEKKWTHAMKIQTAESERFEPHNIGPQGSILRFLDVISALFLGIYQIGQRSKNGPKIGPKNGPMAFREIVEYEWFNEQEF